MCACEREGGGYMCLYLAILSVFMRVFNIHTYINQVVTKVEQLTTSPQMWLTSVCNVISDVIRTARFTHAACNYCTKIKLMLQHRRNSINC